MKKLISTLLVIICFHAAFPQTFKSPPQSYIYSNGFPKVPYIKKKGFIYGTMWNGKDTLVGYFDFDRQINYNGQKVTYKKDIDGNEKKRFKADEYQYFRADSLYLERFPVKTVGNDEFDLLVPRIANGKMELFDASYRWGEGGLFKKKGYFVRIGDQPYKIFPNEFRKQMADLVADHQSLNLRISSGELDFGDIEKIVTEYNEAFK